MRVDHDRAGPMRHIDRTERVMWVTPDRVFYVGLLGVPSARSIGAISLYVALDAPVQISVEGGQWQTGHVAIVQPYVSHRIACDARQIAVIHVEPESVDGAGLPAMLRQGSGLLAAEDFRARALRCHQALMRNGQRADAPMFDFDQLVFGAALPSRSVDPRIAKVLERIRSAPASQALAQDCAAQVHLSFSRFLHLFKSEVGVSFRSFRAWKRARSLLHHVVDQHTTLTDVALCAGYPDSTHFSHSIRQVYGLKPKDIFAGSRKLRVIGAPQPVAQRGLNP
ncbi:helix-turn-helix domain-containing protein [Ottowia sp.]|uniref:helix-turn-helix transcriptional regulator n=1 Tax=Ottowia sp. TaxID=1898956 RepID=UPI003A89508B